MHKVSRCRAANATCPVLILPLANKFAMCQLSRMEQLKTWIAATGTRQSALAEQLRITRGHVSAILSGLRAPSLDLAFRIEDGAVLVGPSD
jgi:DNA-binding XRE family transcriptional regulator